MAITVQEIITAVKGINAGLSGISRLNKPLHFQLTSRCTKLEKQLVSCCDKLVVAVAEDSHLSAEQVQELVAKFESEMAHSKSYNQGLVKINEAGAEQILTMATRIGEEIERANGYRTTFLEMLENDTLSKAEILALLLTDDSIDIPILNENIPLRIINEKGEGEFISQEEYDKRVAAGINVKGTMGVDTTKAAGAANEQSSEAKNEAQKEEVTDSQKKGVGEKSSESRKPQELGSLAALKAKQQKPSKKE